MEKEEAVILIRALVTSKKENYSLNELLHDFKQETGRALPSFGFKTPLNFLKSIPDTVQVVESQPHVKVVPVPSKKSEHIASMVRRQKVSRKGFKRFSAVSKKYFPSISCGSSGNNPDREIYVTENYNQSSTSSSSADCLDNKLFTSSKKSAEVVKEKINSVISPAAYENQFKKATKSIEKDLSQVCSEEEDSGSIINASTIGPVSKLPKIPKLNFKSYAEIGDYIEVCVSEVYTPQKFFLQLRKFKIKLTNLMIQLQLFYNKHGEDFKMNHSQMLVNGVCTALYKTNNDCLEWYRAVILKLLDKKSAIVQLIDYGTIAEVAKDNMRLLHHQFCELPAQAFPGNLANIQPYKKTSWPEKASERFLELVFDKDLVAGIVDINYETLWMSVALTCTVGLDLHICDTLVQEKLAAFINWESQEETWEECSSSADEQVVTYLDLEALIHPSKIMKTQKSRCENKYAGKSRGILLYTPKNDRLIEMFDEYVN